MVGGRVRVRARRLRYGTGRPPIRPPGARRGCGASRGGAVRGVARGVPGAAGGRGGSTMEVRVHFGVGSGATAGAADGTVAARTSGLRVHWRLAGAGSGTAGRTARPAATTGEVSVRRATTEAVPDGVPVRA